MGLFNSQSDDLHRIAVALELLVAHLTKGGPSGSLKTSDEDYKHDGSNVSYVDDAKSYIEETKRLEHFQRTGILLKEGDPIPGPTNEDGREWVD